MAAWSGPSVSVQLKRAARGQDASWNKKNRITTFITEDAARPSDSSISSRGAAALPAALRQAERVETL